jgi:HD superfamily phosphodiesterase
VATAGRDDSHNVKHMDQVRINSFEIWAKESHLYPDVNADRIASLITAVSLFHDIADHKYGHSDDQIQGMKCELLKHFDASEVDLIFLIIDRISYSKEAKMRKKGITPTWEELGHEGRIVRDIVSDADKLEAIGVIGVKRCLQYSVEKSHGQQLTRQSLVQQLVEHANEKLFILKDYYIQTVAGRNKAAPAHEDMVREVNRLEELVSRSEWDCTDSPDREIDEIFLRLN